MSLRLRLTLLYSTLMGGILLVIGAAVIIVVTSVLFNNIDNSLDAAHRGVFHKIKADDLGKLETNLKSRDIRSDIYGPNWGLDGELQSSFGPLEGFSNKPFDPEMLHTDGPIFRDRNENGLHIRVLSIPLQKRDQTIGVLQIAHGPPLLALGRDTRLRPAPRPPTSGRMAQNRNSQGQGPKQRQLRVGELIRRTLADVLARADVHDPDLNRHSITVAEVSMSTATSPSSTPLAHARITNAVTASTISNNHMPRHDGTVPPSGWGSS